MKDTEPSKTVEYANFMKLKIVKFSRYSGIEIYQIHERECSNDFMNCKFGLHVLDGVLIA
jgi:hypothetical protein